MRQPPFWGITQPARPSLRARLRDGSGSPTATVVLCVLVVLLAAGAAVLLAVELLGNAEGPTEPPAPTAPLHRALIRPDRV